MSPAALLQTPQCAVDMKARLVAGRPWAHHLALRVAGARLGSNRVAAPLGGLLPLQRRKGRKWTIGGLAVGVRAFAGDDFGLGWPRDFDSRYRVQDEVLGEGSFGTVKVALGEDGERVAVKMLAKSRGKGADWERYMALLRNEVALWTAVQNSHDKHVARLHGVYEDDEYVYLVQDICEGGDLQRLMKEQGCLGEREAAQAISGVLSMLAACHDRNICYGDVKPANFLLTAPYPCRRHMVDPTAPKGDIVLQGVDFGCSQKLNDRDRLNKRTGTPLYMAPEILFGWYGMEVDMWAAGMMLYQLISGKLPFFGEKAEEFTKAPKMLIVQALMDNELEMTGGVWDKVSQEAKDLISKLLDVDYNTRISARAALQHAWIQRYCDHPSIFYTSKPAEDMRIRTL